VQRSTRGTIGGLEDVLAADAEAECTHVSRSSASQELQR